MRKELKEWQNKKKCRKRDILSLMGKLNYCSQVIVAGQMFMRRIIDVSKQVKHLHEWVYLNSECRKDIQWWIHNIEVNNGTCWFPRQFNVENANIMFTDASGFAAAAVLDGSWTVIQFCGEYAWVKERDICYKELFAIVMGISTFACKLKDNQLLINTDNKSIHHCIEAGKSKDSYIMELIRSLYYYTSINRIDYKSVHVYGIRNEMADALSRNQVDTFFSCCKNADRSMTRPCRFKRDFS